MATSTDITADAHADHGDHPTPRVYVQVALALAALTALEVSTFYVDFGPLFLPTLIGLMVVKFAIVVGFFMHLKFDLGLFSTLVKIGLIGAIVLYGVVLVIFANGPQVGGA